MPFNQKDVLSSNKAYLVGSLELEDIQASVLLWLMDGVSVVVVGRVHVLT